MSVASAYTNQGTSPIAGVPNQAEVGANDSVSRRSIYSHTEFDSFLREGDLMMRRLILVAVACSVAALCMLRGMPWSAAADGKAPAAKSDDAKAATKPADAAVERTRKQVRMLDDL